MCLQRKIYRTPKLTSPISPEMLEINLNIEGVKQFMKKLDPFKVKGPDKIQSRFLNIMAEERSVRVTLIL